MADNVTDIKDLLSDFATKEAELAKAELVPAAKNAGVGTGFLAVSLAFVLHAVWMLVIALSALFTWLVSLTGLSVPLSIVLGFLIAFVLALAFGGLFGLLGWRRFKRVRAPKATIAEAKGLVDAIFAGWGRKEPEIMLRSSASELEQDGS